MHLEHPLVLPLHLMQPKFSMGLAVLASLCSCLMAGAAAGRLIAAAGRFLIVLLVGLAWSFLPCFLPLWSWLKASCSKSSRVLSCHDTSFSPYIPLDQTVRKQNVSCLASCSLASVASAASPAALVSSVVTAVAGEATGGSHGKTWFAGGFAGPAWFGACWAWPCLAFLFFKRNGCLWCCRWSLASAPVAVVGRQGSMGASQGHLVIVCVC